MDSKHQAKQEVQECYAKYMKHFGNKKNSNSNVCFLCGRKGHYGSQTSCYAANQIKKKYNNI